MKGASLSFIGGGGGGGGIPFSRCMVLGEQSIGSVNLCSITKIVNNSGSYG